jgi:DNA invertase Pin-like site-specific DNA recombinase
MTYGYARVSTYDQNPALQMDALEKAKSDHVFQEKRTGTTSNRPVLRDCLKNLRPGDTLIVWKLDRLARSLRDLVNIVDDFDKRGIHFRSLTEDIDTGTPGGKLIFHIFGALAEFEHGLITERTREGLKAARARGVRSGPPPKLSMQQKAHARQLIEAGEHSRSQIAEIVGVSRSTLYRALASV